MSSTNHRSKNHHAHSSGLSTRLGTPPPIPQGTPNAEYLAHEARLKDFNQMLNDPEQFALDQQIRSRGKTANTPIFTPVATENGFKIEILFKDGGGNWTSEAPSLVMLMETMAGAIWHANKKIRELNGWLKTAPWYSTPEQTDARHAREKFCNSCGAVMHDPSLFSI